MATYKKKTISVDLDLAEGVRKHTYTLSNRSPFSNTLYCFVCKQVTQQKEKDTYS